MRLEFLNNDDVKVFLVLGAISAGTPNEITGEIMSVGLLDFLSGGKRDCVFVLRVHGDSMQPGIDDGDIIVVNREQQPDPGKVIVANVKGEYTLKTFSSCPNGNLRLIAKNGKYAPREITRKDGFEVFGTATHVIKKI